MKPKNLKLAIAREGLAARHLCVKYQVRVTLAERHFSGFLES
jgi:hypothetical protein